MVTEIVKMPERLVLSDRKRSDATGWIQLEVPHILNEWNDAGRYPDRNNYADGKRGAWIPGKVKSTGRLDTERKPLVVSPHADGKLYHQWMGSDQRSPVLL